MSGEIAPRRLISINRQEIQGPNKQIDLSFSDKKYSYSTHTCTIDIIEEQTYLILQKITGLIFIYLFRVILTQFCGMPFS